MEIEKCKGCGTITDVLEENKLCFECLEKTKTQCKECGDFDYEIREDEICMVCWAMKEYPEDFTLTKEQDEEWKRCSDYITKHGIGPNMDGCPM